jgi:hypothetical protein
VVTDPLTNGQSVQRGLGAVLPKASLLPFSIDIFIQGQHDNNVFKSLKQNFSATGGDKEVVN